MKYYTRCRMTGLKPENSGNQRTPFDSTIKIPRDKQSAKTNGRKDTETRSDKARKRNLNLHLNSLTYFLFLKTLLLSAGACATTVLAAAAGLLTAIFFAAVTLIRPTGAALALTSLSTF